MIGSAETARPPYDDAAAWHALAALRGPYLPWSPGAMRPAGLVTLLNDVWFGGPALIVELGSGVSTIVLARLLAELGTGHLLAVEHDEAWSARVQRQLDREGLAELVTVLYAPLRPNRRSWDGCQWYDEDALMAALDAAALGAVPIDVLLVDGPPAWQPGAEHSRYPALGMLANRLAPGARIVLDDVERAGEQAVLLRWQQEHGLDFEVRPAAGLALASWPGA